MKKIKNILIVLIAIFGILTVLAFIFVSKDGDWIFPFFDLNIDLIVTITGTLGILLTFVSGNLENTKNIDVANFFKMLDYHNDNVKSLKVSKIDDKNIKVEGRRAFVIFKHQISELLKAVDEINFEMEDKYDKNQIFDIVYNCFFYGINKKWSNFSRKRFLNFQKEGERNLVESLEEKIENHEDKIGRANLTSVSSYYKNLYQAIKFIDESKYFSQKDKKKYIEILQAQLSSPELYVMYFYLLSSFGKEFKIYAIRYELIKDLPLDYISYKDSSEKLIEYNPKEFFPKMNFSEDLINTKRSKNGKLKKFFYNLRIIKYVQNLIQKKKKTKSY